MKRIIFGLISIATALKINHVNLVQLQAYSYYDDLAAEAEAAYDSTVESVESQVDSTVAEAEAAVDDGAIGSIPSTVPPVDLTTLTSLPFCCARSPFLL